MRASWRLLSPFLLVLMLPGCAVVKRPVTMPHKVPEVRVGLEVNGKAVTVSGTGMFQIGIKDSDRKPKVCGPGERWTFVSASGAVADVTGGSEGSAGGETESARETTKGIEVIDPEGLSRGALDGTFVIKPLESESFLVVGSKTYRGSFEVFQSPSRLLTLVNVVDTESYLRGVVPNEIGGLSPQILEAIKAQAVAARTYCFFFAGRYASDGFDLLPTVQDQVYTGVAGEKPVSDKAIADTYGTIATYGGKPVRANYFSTCGGATAAIEEVWSKEPVPYLTSVSDKEPFQKDAYCSQSSSYRWKETWTAEEFESIFRKNFRIQYPRATQPSPGERLVDVRVAERSKSGRVRMLEVITSDNVFKIVGDSIRLVVRRPDGKDSFLRSTLFDVDVQREQGYAKTVVFYGGGNGHGVGMCQMGAIGMAKAGKDFKQILTRYYKGVKLTRAY
ncbi:MAG: SpoIID/LytB domain-containing protein [Candidatus Eisenbacteria bacterium]|nr:SpoIID/LytB domain-containing protein [Candidatus Eisenbacteria bacterium]